MLKFWEKILYFLFAASIIAAIVSIVSTFAEQFSVPLWLPLSVTFYNIGFAIYYILKRKITTKAERKMRLEVTYNKIQRMSEEEKKTFVSSGGAEIYFENVEMLKQKLAPKELLKYKKSLYGNEDPYVVTTEGKIIVRNYPR